MATRLQELIEPRTRDDFALRRGRQKETYWQAGDGLIVRVAVGEDRPSGETVAAHRDLLAAACREAKDV